MRFPAHPAIHPKLALPKPLSCTPPHPPHSHTLDTLRALAILPVYAAAALAAALAGAAALYFAVDRHWLLLRDHRRNAITLALADPPI